MLRRPNDLRIEYINRYNQDEGSLFQCSKGTKTLAVVIYICCMVGGLLLYKHKHMARKHKHMPPELQISDLENNGLYPSNQLPSTKNPTMSPTDARLKDDTVESEIESLLSPIDVAADGTDSDSWEPVVQRMN